MSQNHTGSLHYTGTQEMEDATPEKKKNSLHFRYQMETGVILSPEKEPAVYYYQNISRVNFSFQNAGILYWKSWLGLGAGAGIDLYESAYIIPLCFTLQGKMMPKRKVSPIYFLKSGYGLDPREDKREGEPTSGYYSDYIYEGGLYYGLGLGMLADFRSNGSWYVKFGLQSQKYSESYTYNYPENYNKTERKYTKKRFLLRTGIMF